MNATVSAWLSGAFFMAGMTAFAAGAWISGGAAMFSSAAFGIVAISKQHGGAS